MENITITRKCQQNQKHVEILKQTGRNVEKHKNIKHKKKHQKHEKKMNENITTTQKYEKYNHNTNNMKKRKNMNIGVGVGDWGNPSYTGCSCCSD